MSDIVERLRQVAAAYKSLPTSGIWATMTVDRDASCNNLTDAADEIERLWADVAGLREQVQHLQSLLVDADNICKEHGGCDLQDCIDNDGDLYQSQAMADALDAARKGTTPTRLPPSLSPRS